MSFFASLAPLAAWNGPGWWVIFFPIGWFLFFFLIFIVSRRSAWGGFGWGPHHGSRGWRGPEDATEVLDRRFAEGEMGADEYRERRATLWGVKSAD